MSRNSARQTCEAFMEWHKWAKGQYPELRKKRKPKPEQNPLYMYFDDTNINA
jgi:hypothetical protein